MLEQKAPPKADFVGVVTSRLSKVVPADFEGRILKVYVQVGSVVKAGDVIAELDTSELKAQLANAAAQETAAGGDAGSACAQASDAQRQVLLNQKLFKAGAVSGEAIKNAQAQVSSLGGACGGASGRYKAAKVQRVELERQIGLAVVKAPIGGKITTVKYKEGEVARKGFPIARVFDPSDLTIRFAVPRERKDEIKIGQRVEITVTGTNRLVSATVEKISDDLEPPVNFTMVDADIDDSKLAPDEVSVASAGHVRIAEAGGKR